VVARVSTATSCNRTYGSLTCQRNVLLTSSLSWWPTAPYSARKSPLIEPYKSNPAPHNLTPYIYKFKFILPSKPRLSECALRSWFWEEFLSPTHVPLEKPAAALPLKQFPALDGTRILIIVFTRDRHWSQSRARWIHSIPLSISEIYFNIMLSLRLNIFYSFNLCFYYHTLQSSSSPMRATWPGHLISLDYISDYYYFQFI
jgi:hypothetical protein